jgi:hypothetical protein
MTVTSGCRAALLIGAAALLTEAASSAQAEEYALTPQGVTDEAQQAPKKKLKVERRAHLSTTKRAAEKHADRSGNRIRAPSGNSAMSFDTRNAIASPAAMPLDRFSLAIPDRKLIVAPPSETARTSIDWEQPNGDAWSRGLWSQRGTIQTNLAAPDANLEIFGTKTDVARVSNTDNSELRFVQPKNWERNQVDDLKLKFSTLNETLQFTVRESGSFYSADTRYLLELAQKNRNNNAPGPERFLQSPGTGHADLQRMDLKLYESDSLGVAAFAFRKDVDLSYMSIASAKAKDEFAAVDQTGTTGGGRVRLGAVSFTSSYGNYERPSGRDDLTRSRQDHTIGLDMSGVRASLQSAGLALLDALVPTSLSVTRFESQTPFKTPAEGLVERMTGYAGNAAWKWNSGYSNVGYWNYRLDGEASGTGSYSYAGRGLDAGVGSYSGALGIYGGLSYYQSDDLSPLSHSTAGGYEGYALLTYKLDNFPDLSVNGNLGRYDYAAFAMPASSGGVYWSTTIGFDFSKWLRVDGAAANQTGTVPTDSPGGSGSPTNRFTLKSPVGDKPMLKLFYRYAAESAEELAGGHTTDSHLFGAAFRSGL